MAVRIVQDDEPGTSSERDYVHVETCADPFDDTVTLVTIKRITEKPQPLAVPGPTSRVKTLVRRQPMSADSAVGLARCYAERKQIPVVYAEPLRESTS